MNFLINEFALDVSKKRGTTPLRETATQLKVSASTLSRIESGKLPDLLTYVELCNWMGVSLNKYFESNGDQKELIVEILKDIVSFSAQEWSDHLWKEKMLNKIDKL